MEPGFVYRDELAKVSAFDVEHSPHEISPCFGLRRDTVDGESAVFRGDTAPCDRLVAMAEDCKLLTHACAFTQLAIDFRSMPGIGTRAHANPAEFRHIAKEGSAKAPAVKPFDHLNTASSALKTLMAKRVPVELVGPT